MDAINSIAGTLLVSQETPSQQSFAWGTCDSVTGAMASVILDGDTEAIELPMESGARGMAPGDRCLISCWGREASVQSFRLTS